MPASSSSPSSSAQAARQRLGEELHRMRKAARISGVEFARRAGWNQSVVVSQVEKARRTITADHVRLWCRICGATEQRTAELLAEQAAVANMWLSLREHSDLGLNARQRLTIGDQYSRTIAVRVYQTKVIPALLQTSEYMTEVLRGVRRDRQLQLDDVAEAVAERMGRQRNLRRPGVRFAFLLEETVLRYRPYDRDLHRRQLLHLLKVMRLPAISLAVIPMHADRRGIRPRESFGINTFLGSEHVQVELLSGLLTLTHPDEVAMYRQAWDDLFGLGVVGDELRALIDEALHQLGDP
jgi:transcriptional regulator with XRE-family HTH domain